MTKEEIDAKAAFLVDNLKIQDESDRDYLKRMLQTLIARAYESVEWQPIETAPKDGTRVLLYWPRYEYGYCEKADCPDEETRVAIGRYKTNGRIEQSGERARGTMLDSYFADNDEHDDYGLALPERQATHWMPLPEPPTGRDIITAAAGSGERRDASWAIRSQDSKPVNKEL